MSEINYSPPIDGQAWSIVISIKHEEKCIYVDGMVKSVDSIIPAQAAAIGGEYRIPFSTYVDVDENESMTDAIQHAVNAITQTAIDMTSKISSAREFGVTEREFLQSMIIGELVVDSGWKRDKKGDN